MGRFSASTILDKKMNFLKAIIFYGLVPSIYPFVPLKFVGIILLLISLNVTSIIIYQRRYVSF